MEDVLEVYHRPYRETEPVVCLDEVPKQLVSEVRIPLPPRPRARGLAVGRSDSDEGPPFINVPLAQSWRFPAGLSAGWLVYRGPAAVALEPSGYRPVENRRFSTTAKFTTPGQYVLRAVASDSMLETTTDVTIVVAAAR